MAEFNPERGDVEIELGADRFVMRPTPGATAELEAGTGKGTLGLINDLAARTITLRELAVIVTAGLKASGERGANVPKVEELIWKTGLVPVLLTVQTYLLRSVNGGREVLPFVAAAAEANAWNASRSENGSGSQSSTSGGTQTPTGEAAGGTFTPPFGGSESSESSRLVDDPRATGGVPIPRRSHKLEAVEDDEPDDWSAQGREVGVRVGTTTFEEFRRAVIGE